MSEVAAALLAFSLSNSVVSAAATFSLLARTQFEHDDLAKLRSGDIDDEWLECIEDASHRGAVSEQVISEAKGKVDDDLLKRISSNLTGTSYWDVLAVKDLPHLMAVSAMSFLACFIAAFVSPAASLAAAALSWAAVSDVEFHQIPRMSVLVLFLAGWMAVSHDTSIVIYGVTAAVVLLMLLGANALLRKITHLHCIGYGDIWLLGSLVSSTSIIGSSTVFAGCLVFTTAVVAIASRVTGHRHQMLPMAPMILAAFALSMAIRLMGGGLHA